MRGELKATRDDVAGGTIFHRFKTRTSAEVARRCHCVLPRRASTRAQLLDDPSSIVAKNRRCNSFEESVIRRGWLS